MKLINKETIEDGFTQSEVMTLNECGYKWHLAYNLRLKGIEFDHNFLMGKAWHRFQESYWASKGNRLKIKLPAIMTHLDSEMLLTTEDEQYLEFLEKKLIVLANAYIELYDEEDFDGSVEVKSIEEVLDQKFEVEGIEIRLLAMLDLVANMQNSGTIIDHKTTGGELEAVSKHWEYKFQFMWYFWFGREVHPELKIRKFMVNTVRKPSIRLKKTETEPVYLHRLTQDIAEDASRYFQRETLYLGAGKLNTFVEHTLDPWLLLIKTISDPKTPTSIMRAIIFRKNTHACINLYGKPCPYIKHCAEGEIIRSFNLRQEKHPELCQNK